MAYENVEHGQQGSDASADAGVGDALGGIDSTGADLTGMLNGQEGAFVSDEKKPLSKGTLVMAGILLACGVGTYAMYTRSAAVDGAPTPEAAAAQSTINQFLQGDAGEVTKMKDMLKDTEKVVQQFLTSPGKKQVPVGDLQTNPFRVAAVEEEEEAAPAVDPNASKKQQEERRLAVLKSARALNLQFVMSGKRKTCMINNTVYREGQNVDGFKVEQITADAVVVRKDDARFELRMKK
jgi:preprotein translocase subunit SecG